MSHREFLRFCTDLAAGALDNQAVSFGAEMPDATGVVRWANRLGYTITIEDLTDGPRARADTRPRQRPRIVTGDFRFGVPDVVELLRQATLQQPRHAADDDHASPKP